MPLSTLTSSSHSRAATVLIDHLDLSANASSKNIATTFDPSYEQNECLFSESDRHFAQLKQKGICDENGKEIERSHDQNKDLQTSQFILDRNQLEDLKTIDRLNHKLKKPLEVISRPPYKNSQTKFSLKFNLDELQINLKEQNLLEKMEIAGSAAIRSGRDSLKKVFKNVLGAYFNKEELEILWQSKTIQQKIMRKPNDIDTRWHIKKGQDEEGNTTQILNFLGGLFEKMGEKTESTILQQFFYSKNTNQNKKNPTAKEIAQSVVRNFALEGYMEVFENKNCFCIVEIQPKQGRSHDLTIISKQLNECFFSRDCLKILKNWDMSEADWQFLMECQPFNIRQYFIDLLTSNLSIYNMDTATEQHWIRYLSYQTAEGARFLEEGIEEQLVAKVFENKEDYSITRRLKKTEFNEVSNIQYIFHLISGHLRNHFALSKTTIDGEKAIIFVFHACQSLAKYERFSEEQILELFTLLDKEGFLKINSESMNEAVFIKEGLLKQKLSFREIQQHLKLRTEIFNPGALTRHDAKNALDIPLCLTHSTAILRIAVEVEEPSFRILEREHNSFFQIFYTTALIEAGEIKLKAENLLFLKKWLQSPHVLLNYLSLIVQLKTISIDEMIFDVLFDSLQSVIESNICAKAKQMVLKCFLNALRKADIQLGDETALLEAFLNDKQMLENGLTILRLQWIKQQSDEYFKVAERLLKDERILAVYASFQRIFLTALKIDFVRFEETGISLFKALLPVYPAQALIHWNAISKHCALSLEKQFIFIMFCQGTAYPNLKGKPLILNNEEDEISYSFQFPESQYLQEMGEKTLEILETIEDLPSHAFFAKTKSSFSKAVLCLVSRLYRYGEDQFVDSLLEKITRLSYKEKKYIEGLNELWSQRIQQLLEASNLKALSFFQKAKELKILDETQELTLMYGISQLLLKQKDVSYEMLLKYMQRLQSHELLDVKIGRTLYLFILESLRKNTLDKTFFHLLLFYFDSFSDKESAVEIISKLLTTSGHSFECLNEIAYLLLKHELTEIWQQESVFSVIFSFFKQEISLFSNQKIKGDSLVIRLLENALLFAYTSSDERYLLEGSKFLLFILKEAPHVLSTVVLQNIINKYEKGIFGTLKNTNENDLYELFILLNKKSIKRVKNPEYDFSFLQWLLNQEENVSLSTLHRVETLLDKESIKGIDYTSEQHFNSLCKLMIACIKHGKMKEALLWLNSCLQFPNKASIYQPLSQLARTENESLSYILLHWPNLQEEIEDWLTLSLQVLEANIKNDNDELSRQIEKRMPLLLKLFLFDENRMHSLLLPLAEQYINILIDHQSLQWDSIFTLFSLFSIHDGTKWQALFKSLYQSKKKHEPSIRLKGWKILKETEESRPWLKGEQKSRQGWMNCWLIAFDYLSSVHSSDILDYLTKPTFIKEIFSIDPYFKGYHYLLSAAWHHSTASDHTHILKFLEIRKELITTTAFTCSTERFSIDLDLLRSFPKFIKSKNMSTSALFILSLISDLFHTEEFKERWPLILIELQQSMKLPSIPVEIKLELIQLLKVGYQCCHQPFPVKKEMFPVLLQMNQTDLILSIVAEELSKHEHLSEATQILLVDLIKMAEKYASIIDSTFIKNILKQTLLKYQPSKEDRLYFEWVKKYFEIEFKIEKDRYDREEVTEKMVYVKRLMLPLIKKPELAKYCADCIIKFIDNYAQKQLKLTSVEYYQDLIIEFSFYIETLYFYTKTETLYKLVDVKLSAGVTEYYLHLTTHFKQTSEFDHIYLTAIYIALTSAVCHATDLNVKCNLLNELFRLCPPQISEENKQLLQFNSITSNNPVWDLISNLRRQFFNSLLDFPIGINGFLNKKELILELSFHSASSIKDIKTSLSSSKQIEIGLRVINCYLHFCKENEQRVFYTLYRAIQVLEWIQPQLLNSPDTLVRLYSRFIEACTGYIDVSWSEEIEENQEKRTLLSFLRDTFENLLKTSSFTDCKNKIPYRVIVHSLVKRSNSLIEVLRANQINQTYEDKQLIGSSTFNSACIAQEVDLKNSCILNYVNNILKSLSLPLDYHIPVTTEILGWYALILDMYGMMDNTIVFLEDFSFKMLVTRLFTKFTKQFPSQVINKETQATAAQMYLAHLENIQYMRVRFKEESSLSFTRDISPQEHNKYFFRILRQALLLNPLYKDEKVENLFREFRKLMQERDSDPSLFFILDLVQPHFCASNYGLTDEQILPHFQTMFYQSITPSIEDFENLDAFFDWQVCTHADTDEQQEEIKLFIQYIELLETLPVQKNNLDYTFKISTYILYLIEKILNRYQKTKNTEIKKLLIQILKIRAYYISDNKN